MLESMEGRRGMPRLKPPFPTQGGYLGRPTLINNVETLAHVPAILRDGGERWPRVAARATLVGDGRGPRARVLRGGARRDPRELVDEYAGGSTDEIGAIVPGGAASGILPPAALDVPLTREALQAWGPGRARPACRSSRRPTPAAPPRGDDALLRRGVMPGVHAVPDREPRAPPPRGAARARRGRHAAVAGGRVARRDGEDLDLRPRPGGADSRAERVPPLARPVRAARRASGPAIAPRREWREHREDDEAPDHGAPDRGARG